MQTNLAQRIKWARERANLNKKELAQRVQLSSASIVQLENGTTKALSAETLLRMSDATGTRAHWLAFGTGPRLLSDPLGESQDAACTVPLLDWDQIVTAAPPAPGCPRVSCAAASASPSAYAVRYSGVSMSPLLPDGALCIVDPETEAHHRALVAISSERDGATIRQWVMDGSRAYLYAANPAWPDRITPANHAHILGTVIMHSLTD